MTEQTKTTAAPKATTARKNRTPGEKAQDALDAAIARHRRAHKNSQKADARLQEAQTTAQDAVNELQQAAQMIEYAKKHPDLPMRGFKADPAPGGTS